MKVGIFNKDGEPLGFDYVYEPDPNDMYDEWYDNDYDGYDNDHDGTREFPWSVGYDDEEE